MASRLGARQLIYQAPLQNYSQAQMQSLDPGLQKMYPKCTQAAGDCKLKAPYARGKRNLDIKHKHREEKTGEQFLCTRTLLCSLLLLPKRTAFMGLESNGTSVHFYIVSCQQTMCFSLACGSKGITEIMHSYRLGDLLPLS